MKNVNTQTLLKDLEDLTNQNLKIVQKEFEPLSESQRKWKPQPDKWSIAECLEHLNRYGDYYLSAMQNGIQKATQNGWEKQTQFSSSWLGNWFANSMKPKSDGSLPTKMSAPKDYNPANNETVNPQYLAKFIDQQKQMLDLIQQAQKINLQKVKIPITLTRLIRIRLGDTFRFNIYHNERHVLQAQKVKQDANFPNT